MVPFGEITNNDIANRVSLTLYSVAITLIKVSALTLYARLFQINSRFKISLWVLGIVIVAWGIVLVVLPWTFCHPLSHNVDPLGPGYCTSEPSWYLGSAFVNAFFDLVVLFLPMPIVWRLQLRLKRKILISSVLILGYWYTHLCSYILEWKKLLFTDPQSARLSFPSLASLSSSATRASSPLPRIAIHHVRPASLPLSYHPYLLSKCSKLPSRAFKYRI